MQFDESMVGKRVWDLDDNSAGLITEGYGGDTSRVWVLWEDGVMAGSVLWIHLKDITFEGPEKFEEITINRKRYKLVPIEEE